MSSAKRRQGEKEMRRRYRETDRAEQEGRRLQRRRVCPCGREATRGRLCAADFEEALQGRVLHDA